MKSKCALLAVTLTLAFSMASPAQAAPDKVKAAYVAIMNFAPLYVAIERGFMKEQNIEVEMQKVASGTEAMAFLAQGTLDAGGIGITAATFNAFNKGFDLRIVASAALQPQKDGPTIILVRKDLKDSGKVKSIADLKGMKVGIAGGPGTTGAYFVAKALKEAGLTMKDIEIVNLANPDLPLGIEKGSIDAALVGPALFGSDPCRRERSPPGPGHGPRSDDDRFHVFRQVHEGTTGRGETVHGRPGQRLPGHAG